MKIKRMLLPAGALLGVVPAIAQAQSVDSGDTAWLMTATALVLFMTLPGLALFYGGLVRSKNVLSVLMQCFAICCVVSIVWLVIGYSMAFSETALNGFVGGFSNAFLSAVGVDTASGTIPESVFVMFQLTFAIITPALIVGGFAERMRFAAMLLFTILWVIVVYFPVTHWVWASDGWLFARGFRDFAGGAVVHVNAGVAAIVAALVLKNRRGFPDEAMPPHNMTMTVAGASMLWVGWFGFNGGSALASGGAAGMAILVTHISAAAGSLAWMGMEWIRFGKPSVLGIVTGMVAGLGTITPASGFVGPAGALVIGLIAGVVCFLATQFIKRSLKIDDSLDVFPVHGVGGFLGLLLTAPLSVFLGGVAPLADGQTIGGQFVVQLTGAVATVVWCGVATFVLLKLVGVMTALRVDEDDERQGLDLTQHEERGYNL